MHWSARSLAASLLVVVYTAIFVVAAGLTWVPARGDAAIVVRDPLGLIAGAGLAGGKPWIVIQDRHNSTLFIGETPYELKNLRATTACGDNNRIVVAGLTGRNKTILLLEGARVTARISLSIAPTPRYCDAKSGMTAILFSDPIVWSYVAIIRPNNTMLLARLTGLPSTPTRLAILNQTNIALLGIGYYAILEFNGDSARLTIHNITVSGKIPVLTGASVSGDRLLVVGYVPGGGKAPDRGLVRLGPSQWIMVSPERADRSLRVHAVETSNGRPRLVVEIVGRETQILEMRGEEPGPSVSLSTLAPYILRGVRSGPGYFVITGELFLHENGETVRAKTAYIISSIARFSLARSPTDAVLITRSGSAISTSRLTNASETVTPIQDSLPVRSYTLDRTDEPLSNANGSAKVYGVYVDRAILLCALAAVTSAYTIPVVAAVASYNNVNGGGRRA